MQNDTTPATSPSSPTPVALTDGILLGESARWHDGAFWFSDWVGEKLYRLDDAGRKEVVVELHSLPFCFDWLPGGRMLIVNAREQTVMRLQPDGSLVKHADLSSLSPHGFNEIAIDGRGNVYLNNIDFAFPGGQFKPGFIARLTPDGQLEKVAEGLAFPNGMAITTDDKTLICAESFSKKLTAYDIGGDGRLSNARLWAQFEEGGPDGISLDAEGAIWSACGPSCVRIREGGEILQRIALDRFCFSCALGGADGKTLYMCAADWTGSIPTQASKPTGKVFTARVEVPAARRR
jgi:sugar lactone lactonase YvrE